MHCMVWPHSPTSSRAIEVFVKTTQTKVQRSPRHQGSAAYQLLPVEWDTLHSHQSNFFNPNKCLAAVGGKNHTLCPCVNRIRHVREQLFPKNT